MLISLLQNISDQEHSHSKLKKKSAPAQTLIAGNNEEEIFKIFFGTFTP